MSEVKTVMISDVVDIVAGFAFKSEDFGTTGANVVKIKDIVSPYVDCNSSEKVNVSNYSIERLSKYLIKEGDFVVAMTGATIGKVGRVLQSDEAYINQRVAKFVPRAEVESKYLYYNLIGDSFQAFIENNIDSNSAQENISSGSLGRYSINLPPLPEQQAIAEVLSSLDDKIDLLHRNNKTLEEMAETLFRQWFVEGAKEEWEVVKLKDIVKQIKPGTNYQPQRVSSGIPFINVRNLSDGFIDLSDTSFVTNNEYERVHKSWQPEENDILISRIGTLGVVAVIKKSDLPVVIHYNMINLKAKTTTYQFLYFLLKSKYFQDLYLSNTRQSVQEYVAIEDVENIELLLPLQEIDFMDKQRPFTDFFEKIKENSLHISTLTKTRDTLLPKLMSGQVRVQA